MGNFDNFLNELLPDGDSNNDCSSDSHGSELDKAEVEKNDEEDDTISVDDTFYEEGAKYELHAPKKGMFMWDSREPGQKGR